MIKKLRRKFILVSALSVFFVLFLAIASINIANYVLIENNAKNSLVQILEKGPAPDEGPGSHGGNGPSNIQQEHYFVVSFSSDGTIEEVDNRQMFILSKAECEKLAAKVFANALSGGKYETFRYAKTLKGNGLTYVAFLDLKGRLESAQNFLLVSSLASIGAYAALIGLIMIASKIAFKSNEEAYKKQKRFITNASHELKTPITVISADLDLIEMDNGKSEWSESIRDQLARLTDMTNQLVTLSKLEEGEGARFPFADFSMNEVCKEAVDSFAPLFQKEGIQFASNITGNLTMYGNRALIDELIRIFLDNSLKYTGGENKSSYFTVSQNSKGRIEFRFSNTIGKQEEVDLKQIMERFYRSPSNRKEGSGIGLSIAQEIIDLHKGKIHIEKNQQTIGFTISF
ncbi:MAG: HAMP domain-containing histidine kinase [Bacilli bacterium]|nr:HAMP domain-containing histidine kinase [Bacilli bacterium]